jgi:nucleoside-diphosphate-sugar epimerase
VDVRTFEPLATGRTGSLFAPDLERCRPQLRERLEARRVAVIGAAGSIGSAVVRALLEHAPGALVLFDLDENELVETIRDLRSSAGLALPGELAALPIGLGSAELRRYFAESEPFDYILNLSALKHVRSEKDVFSLMRMIDTNVLFVDGFVADLPRPCGRFFSVSSDKAVNPASLMGATKMVMEKVLLLRSGRQPFSTARFANVAFSRGSLPRGFLARVEKRQPLAAPLDVRRYFISHEEAGQLCLLACVLGGNGDVFFPKLASLIEKSLPEIAGATLRRLGYEPFECGSENEAKARVEELARRGLWPCYFAPSDTTGEKPLEEFHREGEAVDLDRFATIGVVRQSAADLDREAVERFLAFAREARERWVAKEDYVRELRRVVPTLRHVELGRSLDAKI